VNKHPWRGALIGCGFFAANQMHAWRSIPGVEVVTLCDLNVQRARELGATFGVRAIYSDAATMLQREEVDFVDIVTTVTSHRALVELSAAYSKLVICQKPLSETLEDADAMISACRDNHARLLVHENFRWQRPFREIAARLRGGAIGQPKSLRLTFRHAYDIYRQQPYLAQVERLAVMDVGSHLFDLARVLIGEVNSIQCRTRHLNPAIRGEDSFFASLQHDNGAVSVIDCSFFDDSKTELFPQTLAFLEGTDGSLELAAGYKLIERCGGLATQHVVDPEVPEWGAKPWHCIQDSVIHFQRHVLDVLEGRAEPQPSGAHNRGTLGAVLAAYASASQKRTILLSQKGAAA
jgi:predicted dehydrogenase